MINVGGKGKRLMPLTKNIPKPLVKLNGKPVLEHLVEWAKESGITEVVFLTGHLADKIKNHFGDGSKFGIKIEYSNEDMPLGSGGAIKNARKFVNGTFAYISGDLYTEVNLKKMIQSHKNKNAIMSVLLHKSNHPQDSDILQINDNEEVVKFISKHDDHTGAGEMGNAGLAIMEPEVFDYMKEDVFTFETYLYPKLINSDKFVHGYVSEEYTRDIGTFERLLKTEKYMNAEGAIFLDRDGVINKDKGFTHKFKDFELYPKVKEALRKLAKANKRTIIVSNAPVVGRGICTEDEFRIFHYKYINYLREIGGKIDRAYHCFHHPYKGKGKYKKFCYCRKPKPGMLLQAAEDFPINFKKSWMVGDKRSDIKAGQMVGARTILVKTGENGKGGSTEIDIKPDFTAENLNEAVDIILENLNN